MTQHMTFEELKAKNAKEEAQEDPKKESEKTLDEELSIEDEDPKVDPEPEEDPKDDPEEDDPKDPDSDGDPEDEDSDSDPDSDSEDWMKSDEDHDDSDGGEKKFTDSDVASVRKKYKGKLEASKQESDEWKQKYEALKSEVDGGAGSSSNAPAQNRMPRLKDFNYDEDKHEEAMVEWVRRTSSAVNREENQANSVAETRKAAAEKTEKAVNDHYLRVDELVVEAKITPEVYEAADTKVRQTVESVIPNAGDTVTDGIIARLGEGSEKVIYFLGRNKQKRAEFQELLREDPTGISAAMMLGQIKNDFVAGKNRKSNAPKPSDQLNGDNNSSNKAGKLQREYEGTSDLQTRINLKRKAKLSGVDVSGW